MKRKLELALEVFAWFLVIPGAFLSLLNPEIFRLAIGAFGPPPDAGMIRVLAVGAIVTLFLSWRHFRIAGARSIPRRHIAIVGTAIVAILVVLIRSSDIERRNVEFYGNGIRISATIYKPHSDGQHAAVVFVGGSAPFKRGLYALWAEHLARQGIIAIVPDKRGVGGTGGEFDNQNNTSKKNLTLLAGDAVAALRFASLQPEVDSLRLGLFGVSQAGWTVPIAALQSSLARFIIMVTGPTVSVHEEGVWSDLRGDDERAATMSRLEAERMIDTVRAGGVDARSRLAMLKIPGLWLFGSDDASIPTRKSVSVLDSLNRAGGMRFSFDSVPGYGHLVMGRAGRILPHVAPSAWRALDLWLREQGLTKPAVAAGAGSRASE